MMRSNDGVVELARIDLGTPSFLPGTNAAVDAIREHLAGQGVLPGGLLAEVTGQAGIGRDYLQAIQDGTDRTTMVTILLVVLVLLAIYRAPLAALAPLMTIGAAFLVARGVLGFLAQGGWQLSSVLDSFIVVLVFGVGTDYTIFLISRFREELGRHGHEDAVRVTVGRISAVITASAATVIVGLTSMVAARFGMIQTTGPALAIVIFITLLAGLTLTPSLLAIFGRRLFWPIHERTRTAGDETRGFWAALARRITSRPGLLAGAVLVILAIPILGLPQLKQNFDVLNELPAGAESRQGFETLSRHLAAGQLMPLTVLVKAPAGSSASLTDQDGLARVGALEESIAGLPDVRSVSSLVDPMGEGKTSDLLRPSVQLPATAEAFRKPPSTDINDQLSDESLAGIASADSYVSGLADVFPGERDAVAWKAATADLATIHQGLVNARKQALVVNQLDLVAAQLQAAAASPAQSASDVSTQLAGLKAYLEELGAAQPAATSQASYQTALGAVEALSTNADPITALRLLGSIKELSGWFAAQPTPIYFAPTSVKPDAATIASQQAMTQARSRLPDELDRLSAELGSTVLYAPPSLESAYVSKAGDVTRLYVTTATDPYDTKSFDTVRSLRSLLAADASIKAMPAGTAAAPDLRWRRHSRVHRCPGHDLGGLPASRRDHDRRHPDRADTPPARARGPGIPGTDRPAVICHEPEPLRADPAARLWAGGDQLLHTADGLRSPGGPGLGLQHLPDVAGSRGELGAAAEAGDPRRFRADGNGHHFRWPDSRRHLRCAGDIAAPASFPGWPDRSPGCPHRHVRRPQPAGPGHHRVRRGVGLVAVASSPEPAGRAGSVRPDWQAGAVNGICTGD